MTQSVVLKREGSVALILLNRPQVRNALDPLSTDLLTALMRELRDDPSVRAVVLTGAGGDFCAGGDIKGMGEVGPRTPEQRRTGMARYRDLALALAGLDKPLIAALDGVAFGAGLSLALWADIVLVSDRVRLAMVFHRIGLVPDIGAWYTLPRCVGLPRAKELIYSAREFGAQEALHMNLALEVHAPEHLLPRALEVAHSFADASSLALSLSKQALQSSLQSDLASMLDKEAAGQALAGDSDYARESMRRFAAREPAQFHWPVISPFAS